MEKRITTLLTAPNIDANTLFDIYIEIPENQDATLDDFANFMTEESIEREIFLNKYCDYSFIEKEDSIVLKYKVKE